MPNHSIKKKQNLQSNITIDEKHTQLLEEFHAIETETLPELEKQRTALKATLAKTAEDAVDVRMDLKDQIRDLNIEIKHLRNKKNKYLLENAPYIFNYFEEKKKISNGAGSNKTVLNSFFKVKTTEDVLTGRDIKILANCIKIIGPMSIETSAI